MGLGAIALLRRPRLGRACQRSRSLQDSPTKGARGTLNIIKWTGFIDSDSVLDGPTLHLRRPITRRLSLVATAHLIPPILVHAMGAWDA